MEVSSTKARSKMVCPKALVSWCGPMETTTRANSEMENAMARVNGLIKMAAIIMENMKMISRVAEACINGQMEKVTKAVGETVFSTVRALKSYQMVLFSMVCGTWACLKE